jgi:hypothetical protein
MVVGTSIYECIILTNIIDTPEFAQIWCGLRVLVMYRHLHIHEMIMAMWFFPFLLTKYTAISSNFQQKND